MRIMILNGSPKRDASDTMHMTLAIVEIKYTGGVVCIIATLASIHEGHFIRRGGKQI